MFRDFFSVVILVPFSRAVFVPLLLPPAGTLVTCLIRVGCHRRIIFLDPLLVPSACTIFSQILLLLNLLLMTFRNCFKLSSPSARSLAFLRGNASSVGVSLLLFTPCLLTVIGMLNTVGHSLVTEA